MKNQLKELIKALWKLPVICPRGDGVNSAALEVARDLMRQIVLLRAQIRLAP